MQVNCQVEYVAAVEHLLSVTLGALGEVPAKLAFCRQRIAQASKLAQLGAVAGKILEDSKYEEIGRADGARALAPHGKIAVSSWEVLLPRFCFGLDFLNAFGTGIRLSI